MLQKKRFMTTSINYIAHTAPLFIQHGVLRVTDMYKLKLLKFYDKISYNLLPTYFDNYSETLEQNPIRDLRQNLIHGPLIKRVYAECSPLFQLVKLTNTLKKDKNDTILKKKLQIKPIHTIVLHLMLQCVSWTHITLSVE